MKQQNTLIISANFLNELRQLEADLEKKLEWIKGLLASSEELVTNPPIDNFPIGENYINQILFIINKQNRFMRNIEIAEELHLYLKEIDVDELKKKVSGALTRAKLEIPTLAKFQYSNSIKDTVWGRKDWLTEAGDPQENHMYRVESKDSLKSFW